MTPAAILELSKYKNLISDAPAALDTLQELAAALANDANFASTITTALAAKAPLNSPNLSGTPRAPTAATATNNDQIATTAFVKTALNASDSTAVKLTGDQTISGVKTFSSNIVGNITGNSGTATKLQTARTIGGVSFDGTANIDLPGVNITGNQSTTGNAATATKLATARTINGVAFDGSANITVSDSTAVKLTGNQTISGVKTFSSSPILPTPTTDFQATTARSTNITVNVGPGQTYTTINQALEYLSGFYPLYKKSGVTATINLKAGFVMAEQVLVSGIDLGWITIVGEDAETIVTHTALTTAFNGDNYPAFGVDKGGTSPVIGQLFRFDVEKVGGGKHGIYVYGAGSSAEVLENKGFIGAGTHGIIASNGSTINATNANVSNAGTCGIFATGGSTINANGANASNAGTWGFYAFDCSTINANDADASNAGAKGIVAEFGSTINANGANASNAGTFGIVAEFGSTINANGAYTRNAGTFGIYATNGSLISASGADASNTGHNGIYALDGSTINASGANVSNAGHNGIYATNGSTINANSADASNARAYGIYALDGSLISAHGANASNAGAKGIVAEFGSTINAIGAIIRDQTTGTSRVAVLVGSTIEASAIITTGGTAPILSQAANTLTSNGIIYQ